MRSLPKALEELGLTGDTRRLFDTLRVSLRPFLLSKIAEADHGFDYEENLAALEGIVRFGTIPDPLPWHPGEVLELIRWSRPDRERPPDGATNADAHLMRAFACTVLLISGGQPEGRGDAQGENQTLIQLIDSVLKLGPAFTVATANLIHARLAGGPLGDEDRPLFVMGLLLMLRLGGCFQPTQAQWWELSSWLDQSEARGWGSNDMPDHCQWLLDLSTFGLRKDLWEALARAAFTGDVPPGAELIAQRIGTWPT